MINSNISDNLFQTNEKIKKIANKTHRDPAAVRLIAVSKYIEVPKIIDAYNAGQRHFGENRVQELQSKVKDLPNDIQWHLIGHLQSNKVRPAVELSTLIHSVDSVSLLKKIDSVAKEQGKVQKILFQANISGERTKFGNSVNTVEEQLEMAMELDAIACKGLMTMAPQNASEDEIRLLFRKLRSFRDEMEEKHQILLPELSMGMSSDYEIAIEEGATFVRVGTAIFGAR